MHTEGHLISVAKKLPLNLLDTLRAKCRDRRDRIGTARTADAIARRPALGSSCHPIQSASYVAVWQREPRSNSFVKIRSEGHVIRTFRRYSSWLQTDYAGS
jgi:hypothetical protein